jgi:PAS domain S-box-containing protein
MRDEDKTREQLIVELKKLRRKIAFLEDVHAPGASIGDPIDCSPEEYIDADCARTNTESTINKYFRNPGDGTIRPPTDLRRLEEDLRKARDELEVRVRERTAELDKASMALLASKTLFESFARVSPVGIFRTDAGGNYIYVNQRWCDMAGIKSEDSFGAGWLKAVHPQDRERISEEWYNCTREKKPFKSEYRLQQPDGTVTILLGQALAELGAKGEVVGYVGTATDITEQKGTVERLRESEERLRLSLEGSDVGVWDRDVQTGEIVSFRSWASILGYSEEEIELHTRMWERDLHPEDKEWVLKALSDHLEGKTDFYEAEYRMRSKSGEWRWILGRGKVIERDSGGKPLRAVGINMDVTKRKKAEEASRETD